jgi:polysaccharide export outer membrane protein
MTLPKSLPAFLVMLLLAAVCQQISFAQDNADYRLSPGDTVRITVFQNADLQVDCRVADNGTIAYPLAGTVEVGGLTVATAEKKLAQAMKRGGIDIDVKQLSMVLVKAPEAQAAALPGKDAGDYRLGAGDAIRIAVFQNPDLTLESRISDSGTITYPLIGIVDLGGLTVVAAEQKLANLLKDGGFVVDPQLSITLVQVRGSQVSLLGLVNRPGRYPLEQAKMKVTDVLALGGGIVQGVGAESIVLVGMRAGKLMRKAIDVTSMLLSGSPEEDIQIQNGDILFVNKAAVFYLSGEVQRPGSYRLERDMTLMQALATGGWITQRGTERGIRVYRRDEKSGKVEKIEIEMQDPVRPDDVISVRESLF